MEKESNSSVVRVHKNTDFTIMSNHHLRNQKLTLKAVGLMSKILGLPCDWNYSIAGLVKICKEGETAVRAALHELIDERYVYLEKLPPNYSKSGRFEYVYHIYEIPYENIPDGLECPELFIKIQQEKQAESQLNTDSQDEEKQDTENLHLEIQGIEKQAQLNTYLSRTKESSTKELNSAIASSPKSISKSRSKKSAKEHYAEAVTMTEEEYQKLTAQHSKAFVDKCIEILNNYKLSRGKTYKSDYHTILNWVIERVAKDYPQLDKPVGIQNTVYDVNVNPFDQFL